MPHMTPCWICRTASSCLHKPGRQRVSMCSRLNFIIAMHVRRRCVVPLSLPAVDRCVFTPKNSIICTLGNTNGDNGKDNGQWMSPCVCGEYMQYAGAMRTMVKQSVRLYVFLMRKGNTECFALSWSRTIYLWTLCGA